MYTTLYIAHNHIIYTTIINVVLHDGIFTNQGLEIYDMIFLVFSWLLRDRSRILKSKITSSVFKSRNLSMKSSMTRHC